MKQNPIPYCSDRVMTTVFNNYENTFHTLYRIGKTKIYQAS